MAFPGRCLLTGHGKARHPFGHLRTPFSYLIEKNNTTFLVPGVNLKSVGTVRDAQKWPHRDERKDPDRIDQVNYNLLSPTIQKMFKGRKP